MNDVEVDYSNPMDEIIEYIDNRSYQNDSVRSENLKPIFSFR